MAIEDDLQYIARILLKQGFRQGRISHRFYTPQGTQIDVLPVQERATETGFIEFPDGERLTALGFSEALTHAEEKPVGDCVVSVTPLPILAGLKILTATRRHGPDLQDVVACMKQYEEQGTRRFDDMVYTGDITFETAGAYLLRRDLASMMLAKTLAAIEEALMAFTRDVQLSGGTADREELDTLLQAFASGVGLGSL